MVTHVVGKLGKDYDMYDAFRAVFPAGTVSGAPKVRAMEIIDELEPESRGPYAGQLGIFHLMDAVILQLQSEVFLLMETWALCRQVLELFLIQFRRMN